MDEEPLQKIKQHSVGNYNAISGTGNASVTVNQPPVSSVLPEHVWMVLHRRNLFFTGREDLLTRLHDRFTHDRATVLTQGQVLHGLGGIGKTQIAVEYAYRHQDEYRFVLWASADSEETLRASYVQMANLLQIPERTEQTQAKIVEAVRGWLATNDGWLLVVDNADELEQVWPLLPTGDRGHLLLTTRDQAVAGLESFPVEPMPETDGMILLLRRAGFLKEGMELTQLIVGEREVAMQLVTEFGGLPLALDQAGAYVKEAGCSIAEYLKLYHSHRSKLLGQRGRTNNHPLSVVKTFGLLFEQVEQQNQVAADLLRCSSFLAPDTLPEEFFIEGAVYLGPQLKRIRRNALIFNEAIRLLQRFSLISRNSQSKQLLIHRLVQSVLLDTISAGKKKQWQKRIINALFAIFPEATWDKLDDCDRLAAHVQLCASWVTELEKDALVRGKLLRRLAQYFMERGQYSEAETNLLQAYDIHQQYVGSQHPDSALIHNDLAIIYRIQGKYEEAEQLHVDVLAICEPQLGEHHSIAWILNNLAILYKERAKYDKAESLYQQALHIWEQIEGPDYLQVSFVLNNLAELYYQQGNLAAAEPLYLRAISISERLLGSGHQQVAHALNNLANLYVDQKKYAKAEPLYVRAITIWEYHLGRDHHLVAHPLNNLGELYRELGKYTEAEQLYWRAFSIWKKQFSYKHHLVAYPIINLAEIYTGQGKYAEAKPLYLQALYILEHQLEDDHPSIAYALHGLAVLARKQGEYQQAATAFLRTLSIRQQKFVSPHLDLAETQYEFGILQQILGQYDDAYILYKNALESWIQLCGIMHPKTTDTYKSITVLLYEMGRFKDILEIEKNKNRQIDKEKKHTQSN